MSEVYEMIYLPTARCNCRCAHCGLNFDTVDNNEKSCAEVAEAIIKSEYVNSNVVVQICGGEPFLRNDIAGFVIPILKTFECCYVSITTNGILTSNIANFADSIPPNLRGRVGFAISIDGIGETHNQIRKYKNAYNLAIQTTKIIANRGFKLHINTVIHEENIDQLKEMKRLFSNIPISFIPIFTDASLRRSFPYSDGAIQAFFTYLDNHPFFIKYICSKGHMSPPPECHAGEKNIVIMPNGSTFTCKVGASYKSNPDSYYMGNICDSGFDNVWENRNQYGALDYARGCLRCNNPCDIEREHNLHSLSYALTDEEVNRFLEYSSEDIYYGEGWHPLEVYDGVAYRWMMAEFSHVYVSVPKNDKSHIIQISYINSFPGSCKNPITLKISTENNVVYEKEHFTTGAQSIGINLPRITKDIAIKYTFAVNMLWQPKMFSTSNDNRDLGVVVTNISVSENILQSN